jgi:glycosyltransferase involved in cell wall biosynthesis
MTKQPLVSILVPVYNRKSMIEECVHSALRQTYQDVEVVIVDNASSDGTWEVCQRLAVHDRRVRVFQNDSNIGPVRNWRRCLTEARGEYAKFLYSDDLIRPRFLELLMPFLRDGQVGLAFCAAEIGETEGSGVLAYAWAMNAGKYESRRFINDALFGGRVPASPCAAVCRLDDLKASLHEELPGVPWGEFTRHGAGSDLLTLVLTAQRYPLVGFVSEPLVFFRSHPGSITIENAAARGLEDYYNQAKVWFCAGYESGGWARLVLLQLWLLEMKRLHRWLPFGSFPLRYGHSAFRVRFVDLIRCLACTVTAKAKLN